MCGCGLWREPDDASNGLGVASGVEEEVYTVSLVVDAAKQLEVLTQGTVRMVPVDALVSKVENYLQTKKPLRIKLGLDPTAADLHLGHTVVLQKLRDFQQFGHQVQLVIGDWTARIGDPTGRSSMRRSLTAEEIKSFARTYEEQAFSVLLPEQTEIFYNSDWLSTLTLNEIMHLMTQCTVARLLEREDFAARHQQHKPIGLHEFMYPLLQGYDSVHLKSDVEVGGTDQTFNLMMGRHLQRVYGMSEQVVITMPLLVGLDGQRKMSKSLGNHIALQDNPADFYGKVMSLPDTLLIDYFALTTDATVRDMKKMAASLADHSWHPRDAKMALARQLVARYHNAKAAQEAEEHFRNTIQQQGLPQDLPITAMEGESWSIIDVLVHAALVSSRSEARRQIRQGAVRIDGERCVNEQAILSHTVIVQVGRRRFARIAKKPPQ